jgi:acetyl esterase/lipase
MNTDRLRDAGRLYTGAGDPLDPLISPIGGDLSGLPPLLIQVGGDEVMLDDSTVFAERARAAGVAVDCEIWDGLWHVFQNHTPRVPEADQALDAQGRFIRRHLP